MTKIFSYNNGSIFQLVKIIKKANGTLKRQISWYNNTTNQIISVNDSLLLSLTRDNFKLQCVRYGVCLPGECCSDSLLANNNDCLVANNNDCIVHNGS